MNLSGCAVGQNTINSHFLLYRKLFVHKWMQDQLKLFWGALVTFQTGSSGAVATWSLRKNYAYRSRAYVRFETLAWDVMLKVTVQKFQDDFCKRSFRFLAVFFLAFSLFVSITLDPTTLVINWLNCLRNNTTPILYNKTRLARTRNEFCGIRLDRFDWTWGYCRDTT